MTITFLVQEYLLNNFDSSILVRIEDNFTFYRYPMDALSKIVELFNEWADNNTDEYCQDPVNLFYYCLDKHSFGAIMDIYYQEDEDFIREIPNWFYYENETD
jgi:hypothetical protein